MAKRKKEKKRKTKRGETTNHRGITLAAGRYVIRVRGRCPRTGKEVEKQKVLDKGATVRQAKVEQERLRKALEAGPTRAQARMTVGDYARSWIEHLATTKKVREDTTLRGRVEALDMHILPVLGDLYIDELTPLDIKSWQSAMKRKKKPRRPGSARAEEARPYNTATINNWWRILRAMLRDAVTDLNLSRDPTLRVQSLPEEAAPKAVLTKDELVSFLVTAKKLFPEHFALTCFLMGSGLRFGEASAVHWDDLDEREELVQVRRRQVRGRIAPVKNKKSRAVALDPWVFEVLREHRRQLMREQAPGWDKGIAFPSDVGGYRHPSVLYKPFDKIVDAAGIEKHVTPHTLRRTYNNLMRQRGVDRMTLRAMTGHSSEEMTEHYSEVTAEEKRAAVAVGISPVLRLVQQKTGVQTGVDGGHQ